MLICVLIYIPALFIIRTRTFLPFPLKWNLVVKVFNLTRLRFMEIQNIQSINDDKVSDFLKIWSRAFKFEFVLCPIKHWFFIFIFSIFKNVSCLLRKRNESSIVFEFLTWTYILLCPLCVLLYRSVHEPT